MAGAEDVAVKHGGECTAEDTGPKACTKEYKPVCGYVEVQCIKAPCYPQPRTFGNSCEAYNANATNVTEGACGPNDRYDRLANTSWKLQSFDNQVATGPTLSFAGDRFSAKFCNSIAGDYVVDGSKLMVNDVMSTLMFCTGPLGTYETAFDLSGAQYELATDGANHLMITTVAGHTFQWQAAVKNPTKPTPTTSWRRYGVIIWQLNQIAKIRGFDTVIEKQAMAQGLLERINEIMAASTMTPLQNAKWVHLQNAIQFYYDYVGQGVFDTM